MAIFRITENKDYTVMSNHHLRNKKLSLKAKGLLSVMLSLPDDWDFTLRGLAYISKEGIHTIRVSVNELEEHGYIKRHQMRNEKGQLSDIVYDVYNIPAKVLLDSSMNELCASIQENGILSPIIARPHPEGGYEVLSGHRRLKACELLGIEEVPVMVKELDDDTAAILLVDSNLQRENILPSEKAFAYKLKLEALKHQGKSLESTSRQFVGKLESADFVGQGSGDSGRQVQRYIRLTNLIDPLLDLVDKGAMAMSAGVELSYLGTKHQAEVYKVADREQTAPSIAQAAQIRKLSDNGTLDEKTIEDVLTAEKENKMKIVLYEDKFRKYFPKNYSQKDIEDTVIKLIQKWHRNLEKEKER